MAPQLLSTVTEMVFVHVCSYTCAVVPVHAHMCVYWFNQVKDSVLSPIFFFSHLSCLISRKMLFTLAPYYHNEIEKKLKWKWLPPGDSVHMTLANRGKTEGASAAIQEPLLLNSPPPSEPKTQTERKRGEPYTINKQNVVGSKWRMCALSACAFKAK